MAGRGYRAAGRHERRAARLGSLVILHCSNLLGTQVLEVGYTDGSSSVLRGPLIFCLLLSMFLSMRAQEDQSSLVFSGVFCIVWLGEAVVTLQIKLLGGNMYAYSADGEGVLFR